MPLDKRLLGDKCMLSIFKTSKGNAPLIDTISAFHIWNLARARYNSIVTYQLHRSLIHDRDFYAVATKYLEDMQDEANIIEKMAKKYKVKLPERPPAEIRISDVIPAATDSFIYSMLFENLVGELFSLGRAFNSHHQRLRKTAVC